MKKHYKNSWLKALGWVRLFQRWGQPGQQQGRRFPSISSAHARWIWFLLVSNFLNEVIQQIHSLRASGVRSFQESSAAGLEERAFRKSSGTTCTTPVAMCFLSSPILLIINPWIYKNSSLAHIVISSLADKTICSKGIKVCLKKLLRTKVMNTQWIQLIRLARS